MIAQDVSPLLVVEDSEEDYTALRWALRKVGVDRPLRRCATGAELFDYLRRTGPYAAAASGGPADSGPGDAPTPALILLDLNLGVDDGRDVLARLKADAALRRIPVVVWTTSAHPDDVAQCYAHGASGYATKPVDVDQLVESLRNVTRYWFGCVILPDAAPGAPARASSGARG
ncbi:two-component system response regulator [Gemmatimonadetes bacterium T265]|nr:two-component system response regulator [Gemmatimonadetes bacterium T265]